MSVRERGNQGNARVVIDLTREADHLEPGTLATAGQDGALPNCSTLAVSNGNGLDNVLESSTAHRSSRVQRGNASGSSSTARNAAADEGERRVSRSARRDRIGRYSGRGRARRVNARASNTSLRGLSYIVNSLSSGRAAYVDDVYTMFALFEHVQDGSGDRHWGVGSAGLAASHNDHFTSYERMIELERQQNFGKRRLAASKLRALPTRKYGDAREQANSNATAQFKKEVDSQGREVYVLLDSDEEQSGMKKQEEKQVAERDTCPVCLTDFEGTDVVRDLPCQHFFHKGCIDKWLATDHFCPICRYDLSAT